MNIINANGGKLKDAVGIPEDQLRKAAKSAVCKINIDSDGRLVITAIIRKVFAENPSAFDPRKYLSPARDELVKMVKEKNQNVVGSAGKIKHIRKKWILFLKRPAVTLPKSRIGKMYYVFLQDCVRLQHNRPHLLQAGQPHARGRPALPKAQSTSR